MIPLMCYNLSYGRKAFKTKIDTEGLPAGPLQLMLERAARFVEGQSEGSRRIVNKAKFISTNRDKPVELMVLVHAGSDQYEEYLAAVKQFEDRIATWLIDQPVDITFRTIEDNGPKCDACGEKSEWVRHTQFAGSHYFCTVHAEAEPDFGDPDWKQLEATTT